MQAKVVERSERSLSDPQKRLLLALQLTHPGGVKVIHDPRPRVFRVYSTPFFPRTMAGLWKRGLVSYHETAGDRIYQLTPRGLRTMPRSRVSLQHHEPWTSRPPA